MEIKDRLIAIRENRGYTKKEVSEKSDIPYTTYIKYEYGDREIGIGALQKLADFYNVTTDYLLGREEREEPSAIDKLVQEENLEELERRLLTNYLKLNKKSRDAVIAFVKASAVDENDIILTRLQKLDNRVEEEQEQQKIKPIEIRYSNLAASAGTGDFLEGEEIEEREFEWSPEAEEADLVIPVNGNSMEPDFHDGDNLLVKFQPDVNIGEIGVFIMDGSGYVKKRGKNCLISLNEEYEPKPFTEDIRCVGKVLGVAKEVKKG